VEYYRDIRPIFEAICKNSWVNEMGYRGHGLGKTCNFLDPVLEEKLCDNGVDKEDLRLVCFIHLKILITLFT
jgi:hypothetical protein